MVNPIKWLAHEAWEKINIFETWRELKALGRKHGPRFFVAALGWEIIEDVVFPFLSWHLGAPELIPVFLVLHFEPVVYPVFFFLFRTWDRIQGKEPWEPDRMAMSSYWRTGTKVLLYRIASAIAFLLILNHLDLSLWLLTGYSLLMVAFSAVHERLWHDSNFGIDVPTDTVRPVRTAAKVLSYRAVSTMVGAGVLFGALGYVPVASLALYQVTMIMVHGALESIWAKTPVGLVPVPTH